MVLSCPPTKGICQLSLIQRRDLRPREVTLPARSSAGWGGQGGAFSWQEGTGWARLLSQLPATPQPRGSPLRILHPPHHPEAPVPCPHRCVQAASLGWVPA